MAQSSLPAKLKRSVTTYAGQLTRLVKTYAPAHLRDNIRTETKEVSPGVMRVTVRVSAPDARAQEYGSGLHKDGRMGTKAKYPIYPKNKKLLAFRWDIHPDNATYLPDGRILLAKVMHPGIKKYKGRGYVRPAVREWTKNIKNSDINKAVKEALLGDVRKAFETGWKKNG